MDKALLEAYVWATQLNLGTLEELLYLKRSTKTRISSKALAARSSRIQHQRSICLRMLLVCQKYESEIEWGRDGRVGGQYCTGVQRMLASKEGLESAMRAWVSDRVNPF